MPAKAAKKKKLSVLKRARQADKKHISNIGTISKVKTLSKKVGEAIAEKSKEKTEQLLKEATKTIQSAVSKGVLHKNTASRKISRLSKRASSVLKSAKA